jgi:hypothetical protein
MPKQTGLGWTTLSVDDSGGVARDIRNDVTNFNFATPRGVQDVTGIDKSAMERLLLLADFSITLNGVFNPDTNKAHDVLSSVTSGTTLRTTTIVISAQTLAVEALYTDYALTRNQDGSLTWTSPGVNADGTIPTWTP